MYYINIAGTVTQDFISSAHDLLHHFENGLLNPLNPKTKQYYQLLSIQLIGLEHRLRDYMDNEHYPHIASLIARIRLEASKSPDFPH